MYCVDLKFHLISSTISYVYIRKGFKFESKEVFHNLIEFNTKCTKRKKKKKMMRIMQKKKNYTFIFNYLAFSHRNKEREKFSHTKWNAIKVQIKTKIQNKSNWIKIRYSISISFASIVTGTTVLPPSIFFSPYLPYMLRLFKRQR